MTLPEVLLWRNLKQWRQEGYHVRRQHPIGPYVLDFYCDEHKLAIEVDGYMHSVGQRLQRDTERDDWLALRKIRTLRLPARLVLHEMESALDTIRQALEQAANPSP